jgi:hypothetical protein
MHELERFGLADGYHYTRPIILWDKGELLQVTYARRDGQLTSSTLLVRRLVKKPGQEDEEARARNVNNREPSAFLLDYSAPQI